MGKLRSLPQSAALSVRIRTLPFGSTLTISQKRRVRWDGAYKLGSPERLDSTPALI